MGRGRLRPRVTFCPTDRPTDLPSYLPTFPPTFLPTYLPTTYLLPTYPSLAHRAAWRPCGRRASSPRSPARSSSAPPTSARSRLGRGLLALGLGRVAFGLLGSGVFGFGSRSPHSGAQVSISLILESFARKSSGLNRGQRRMSSTPGLDTGILKGLVGGPLGLD